MSRRRSNRSIALLLGALAFAVPGAAGADQPDLPRWQYGFTYAGGAEQIGRLGFTSMGLQLRIARKLTPELHAAGGVDMLATYRGSGEQMVMGETLRGTLGLEWEAGRWGTPELFGGAVQVVAGGGTELITWERGLVSRPIAYLGAQTRIGFLLPRNGHLLRGMRSLSYTLGVRMLVADGIAPDKVPMQPPSPSPAARLELGFLAYMGLDFGR